MNLKLMLEEAVRKYAGKTAVTLGDRRLSYAELDEASNKVANALLKIGVEKGDRVAMLLVNSPEFVIIYLGIVKIGAIAVPLDTKYKVSELTALFNDSQPKVLVAEGPALEPIISALPRFKSIKYIIDLSSEYEGQFISYREIMATGSAQAVEVGLEPEDIAHIAYTSGPTLHPRGVMLSHQRLVVETAISGEGFQQTDKDIVVLFALPLHHAFGLVVILLTAIVKGSTVVMVPGVSIANLLETIERERCTIFMAVPFVYALMVNTAEEEGVKYDLSSLRLCTSAGAAMPSGILEKFEKYYGLRIVDFWGQTESTAHITCQSLNGVGKPGSVGKALPGWELKIVDDNGRELPLNQLGEIIVRGPVMKGYYNNPQATAKVIKDGWLHTDDVGRVDEDGWVFLSGRKKDMIIAKGQNIYPSDIEEVLRAHPQIAEAAVVGIHDEIRGEIVRAIISLKAGEVVAEQEIKQFCLEHLANYKVPKQIIFMESLPKTADGKINKEELQ